MEIFVKYISTIKNLEERNNFGKENKAGCLTLPDFKTYSKAIFAVILL